MSDVSTVAENIYFKNSTLPSSTAGMLVDAAAREIQDVLETISNTEFLNELKEEGRMMTGSLANETSNDQWIEDSTSFPSTAVNFIVESVSENISRAIQITSEETSSETFGNTTEETNGTFIGNLTTTNSTLTEDGKEHLLLGDWFLICAVVICFVILFAKFMNILYKSSSDRSYYPSQAVAKYRARYPKIDEEEGEQEIEFGATTSDINAEGEQAGGEIRKTEALVPCTSSKPKKPKKCTPLPFAWDFDGKIVAEIETEYKPAHDDAKDSETQTTSQEIDNEMTTEQLDQLKEECKDFELMDD